MKATTGTKVPEGGEKLALGQENAHAGDVSGLGVREDAAPGHVGVGLQKAAHRGQGEGEAVALREVEPGIGSRRHMLHLLSSVESKHPGAKPGV